MEIILCKIRESEGVQVAEEVASIESFISYNNILSLEANLNSNDWELQVNASTFHEYGFDLGDWVYIVGSEYGGIIQNIENTDGIVKLSGANFRGYLTKHVIVPPHTSSGFGDYYSVTGEANEVIFDLFQRDDSPPPATFNDPYVVGTNTDSGKTILGRYRFVQYLSGVTKTLRSNGLRLETKQVYPDEETILLGSQANKSAIFSLSAQSITNYSEEENFSSDFEIKVDSGINTEREVKWLFALGSGELENRMIVVLEYGATVVDYGTVQSQGSLWDSAIYDYPNAESREELIESAKDYYKENFAKDEYIELDVEGTDIEFFLGDIIQAEDFVTGLSTKAEITVKELTVNENGTEIVYKVGGL